MRVCIVYDHLYPATIGGGERWLHDLALAVAREGHEVTYLTMRHWDAEAPTLPGVDVVGLVPAGVVHGEERRSFAPPVRFGVAVGRYLVRHGRGFDVVHVAAFPFFPLIAAGLVRRRGRYRLVGDWFEAWTRQYWQRYAGRVSGSIGWLVQRTAVRVRHQAFCNSQHTRRRLLEEGFRGEADVLPGLYAGPVDVAPRELVEPVVVYAGRHVREKRVPLLVAAFAVARRSHPELRLELYGDGPDRTAVEAEVARLGLSAHVVVHGRRPQHELENAFARAACLATASEREGYGLIVVEAAARGTPSVVVAGEENAAGELVTHGVNGFVAHEPTPESIGAAIAAVVSSGPELRASTLGWFRAHADDLRIERSIELVTRSYARSTR